MNRSSFQNECRLALNKRAHAQAPDSLAEISLTFLCSIGWMLSSVRFFVCTKFHSLLGLLLVV